MKSRGNKGHVVREFVEEGVSGTTFERPALGRLLAMLRDEGGSDVVVLVERSDRMARDNLAAELILQEFRNLNVQVIDCEADLDLTHDDDPSKVLIRQILQAVAEFDKSSLVKKLRKARDRKRALNGRCEGAKPYGQLPGEAEILGRIHSLRSVGFSIREIRDKLNDQGCKARSGRPWSSGSVGKITKRIDRQREDG